MITRVRCFALTAMLCAVTAVAAHARQPDERQLNAPLTDPLQPEPPQVSDADRIIARCSILDGSATPAERKTCWGLASDVAPMDPRVITGLQRAGVDAEKVAITQAQSKSSRDSIEYFLAMANRDLVSGSVDGADSYVTRVLEIDKQNAEALALRTKVGAARKWQARKNLLIAVGTVTLAFSAGLIAMYKRFAPKREADGAAAAKPVVSGSPSRVALRIVDGLGRGRMYNIEKEDFRIGAAESDRAEEKNDLVLSDGDALISRFHCALLHQKKKWTIVDSSVNGTWVNDERLDRGEPVVLRDGDEITIAGVSRMIFIGR